MWQVTVGSDGHKSPVKHRGKPTGRAAPRAVDLLRERLSEPRTPDEVSDFVAVFVREARPWGTVAA